MDVKPMPHHWGALAILAGGAFASFDILLSLKGEDSCEPRGLQFLLRCVLPSGTSLRSYAHSTGLKSRVPHGTPDFTDKQRSPSRRILRAALPSLS